MLKLILPCFAILPALFPAALHAADLRVEVRGITHDGGKIMMALIDQTENFPNKPAKSLMVDATPPAAHGVFTSLPPGEYAVSIYHDENGNGKLDTNLINIPIEQYGFSRDARGKFGPPSFADAAFKLENTGLSIVINLH